MDLQKKIFWIFGFLCLLSLRTSDGDGIRLPDQLNQQTPVQHFPQQSQAQPQQNDQKLAFGEERRQGKGLLDLVGLGTGPNTDPYVARTNANCLQGELAECFKTQALGSFDEFFGREVYQLTDFARVVRMPQDQLRSLYQEPYEFSTETRAADSEWDQLLKFGLRKIEKFVKSVALEVHVPEELTGEGRYSPRFIDDIDSEIDVIEDKKASFLTRRKLKKLFIPLLLVLKIFKLKLLLFLPFILGLAGLKKVLGLAAIVVPGLIAYFKLCRPQQNFGNYYSNGFSQYSPEGIGAASYHDHHHQHFASGGGNNFYPQEPAFSKPYTDYYSKSTRENGIRFGDHAQDIAYQGYPEYRSNKKESS